MFGSTSQHSSSNEKGPDAPVPNKASSDFSIRTFLRYVNKIEVS